MDKKLHTNADRSARVRIKPRGIALQNYSAQLQKSKKPEVKTKPKLRLAKLNTPSKIIKNVHRLLHRPRYAAIAFVLLLTIILPPAVYYWPGKSFAATAGPNSPVTGADNAGTGTVVWTNPGNIAASDAVLATQSLGSLALGHYLFATNYGFTIPAAATINGVTVEVQETGATAANAKITDNSVLLVKAGATTGTTQATTATWPSSSSYITYGGSASLWGTTLTPTDVNATNFGVAVSAKNVKISGGGSTLTASIDHIRITVTYTVPYSFTQASYRLFNNTDVAGGTAITFAKSIGGTGTEDATDIAKTSDGGYITTGKTTSYGNTGASGDAYIAKFTSTGTLSWMRTWGGTGTEDGIAVMQTSDGGYAMAGDEYSYTDTSFGDTFVAKYDSAGTLTWSRTWGGINGADNPYSITESADAGIVVAGTTRSLGAGNADGYLLKFSSTGTLAWNTVYGTASYDGFQSVSSTSDGGFIVGGLSNGVPGALLVKYTSAGVISWSKAMSSVVSEIDSVKQTTDGGYIVTGRTTSSGGDAFLGKFDSAGGVTWVNTWGGASNEYANSVIQTSDGGYAISGRTQSFADAASGDAFLVKFDTNGNFVFNKTWGVPGFERGYRIVQASDGGYAMATDTSDATYGTQGALIKFDSTGNIANCSTLCTTPTATLGILSPTVSNATATVGNPTVTVTTPTAGVSSPTPNVFDITPPGVPTIDVGTPLAALNTAATISGDSQAFRLRMDIGVSVASLPVGGQAMKLQYAALSGTCATTPTANFADVTDTSTVAYYDNPTATNTTPIVTNANDPTDGANVIVAQSYQEKTTTTFNNTAAEAVGQDGMWDFALTTNQTLSGTHYCMRVVKSDGTLLNTYTNYPEIITPAAALNQAGYRWFNDSNAAQSTGTYANAYQGATGGSSGLDGIVTNDGGYVDVGNTSSFGPNANQRAYISKKNSGGVVQWLNTWGGDSTQGDSANAVTQTSDNGYVMVGNSWSYAASGDAEIVKYDSNGVYQWSRLWGSTTGNDVANCVTATSDGGVIVTGSYSTTSNGTDVFLAKYTSTGTLSWSSTFDGPAHGADNGVGVIQSSDGGYVVSGTVSIGTGSDAFIAKYSSTGTLSWTQHWGNSGAASGTSGGGVVQASDGGFVMAANSSLTSDATQDFDIIKYTSAGAFVWNHAWGGSGYEYVETSGHMLIKTADNGYALTGYDTTLSTVNGMPLIKFDSAGSLQWVTQFFDTKATSSVSGYGIGQFSDGSYLGISNSGAFSGGGSSVVTKYDTSGLIAGCASACQRSTTARADPTGASSAALTVTSSTPAITSAIPAATTLSVNPSDMTVIVIVAAAGGAAPVGTALAGVNVPTVTPGAGVPVRLRMIIGATGSGVGLNGQTFKLQYAIKSGSCSASTYSDIAAATPLQWYNNPKYATGSAIAVTASDVTDGSNTVLPEAYVNANNFSNGSAILYAHQDGLWDFSLMIPTGSVMSDFCVRAVTSTGTVLNSYSQYPEIQYGYTTPQRLHGGKFFDASPVLHNLFTN